MDVFDFLKSINTTKENLVVDEKTEKLYIPYIINRSLSYHKDTIFHANLMNRHSSLDKKIQYDYYRMRLTKGKRYSKWHKNDENTLNAIKFVYKCSTKKAIEIISLLSKEQLKIIEDLANFDKKP